MTSMDGNAIYFISCSNMETAKEYKPDKPDKPKAAGWRSNSNMAVSGILRTAKPGGGSSSSGGATNSKDCSNDGICSGKFFLNTDVAASASSATDNAGTTGFKSSSSGRKKHALFIEPVIQQRLSDTGGAPKTSSAFGPQTDKSQVFDWDKVDFAGSSSSGQDQQGSLADKAFGSLHWQGDDASIPETPVCGRDISAGRPHSFGSVSSTAGMPASPSSSNSAYAQGNRDTVSLWGPPVNLPEQAGLSCPWSPAEAEACISSRNRSGTKSPRNDSFDHRNDSHGFAGNSSSSGSGARSASGGRGSASSSGGGECGVSSSGNRSGNSKHYGAWYLRANQWEHLNKSSSGSTWARQSMHITEVDQQQRITEQLVQEQLAAGLQDDSGSSEVSGSESDTVVMSCSHSFKAAAAAIATADADAAGEAAAAGPAAAGTARASETGSVDLAQQTADPALQFDTNIWASSAVIGSAEDDKSQAGGGAEAGEAVAAAAAAMKYLRHMQQAAKHQAQLNKQLKGTFALRAYKEFLLSKGYREPSSLERLPIPTNEDVRLAILRQQKQKQRRLQLQQQQQVAASLDVDNAAAFWAQSLRSSSPRKGVKHAKSKQHGAISGSSESKHNSRPQNQQQQPQQQQLKDSKSPRSHDHTHGVAACSAAAAIAGTSAPSAAEPGVAQAWRRAAAAVAAVSLLNMSEVTRVTKQLHELKSVCSPQTESGLDAEEWRLLEALLTGRQTATALAGSSTNRSDKGESASGQHFNKHGSGSSTSWAHTAGQVAADSNSSGRAYTPRQVAAGSSNRAHTPRTLHANAGKYNSMQPGSSHSSSRGHATGPSSPQRQQVAGPAEPTSSCSSSRLGSPEQRQRQRQGWQQQQQHLQLQHQQQQLTASSTRHTTIDWDLDLVNMNAVSSQQAALQSARPQLPDLGLPRVAAVCTADDVLLHQSHHHQQQPAKLPHQHHLQQVLAAVDAMRLHSSNADGEFQPSIGHDRLRPYVSSLVETVPSRVSYRLTPVRSLGGGATTRSPQLGTPRSPRP